MQKLMLAGNVGKDAVLRTTQSGEQVLNFSIAVDNGKDQSGAKRPPTWFDCAIWGKRAPALEPHIRKGSKLTLIGRPTGRHHEGKVYLGITVDDLTFMGGGGDRDEQQQAHDRAAEPERTAARGGGQTFDDEIPFTREWRL